MATPKKTLWKPGSHPYADFLAKLTPEEKEAHLLERSKRKTMKRAFEIVVQEYQSHWIDRINQAMVAVIGKAIREGDANALAVVFDRIVGKPTDTLNTEQKILPWNTEE